MKQQNIDTIRQRFSAFWQSELFDRCMISVTVTDPVFQEEPFPTQTEDQTPYWTDGEWVHQRIMKRLQHTRYYGDAMPIEFVNLGAATPAGYYQGSHPIFRENSIWYDPSLHADETLALDPQSLMYRATLDMAQYLLDAGQDHYFVAPPDITGNADVLGLLRGSDHLLMDMALRPDWVQQQLTILQQDWAMMQDQLFNLLNQQDGGGNMIGWMRTWAPKRHGQMQCDLACMISPTMFQDYALPELRAQCEYFDYPLYHFDGMEQIRHLDMLLSLDKLNTIQWTHVDGQPSPTEFIPVFQRMQAAGKNILFKIIDNQDVEPLMTQLNSKGLYFVVDTDNDDEAKSLIQMAHQLTHD